MMPKENVQGLLIGSVLKMTIFGEPTPKGRPKVAMRGKFPQVYTPKQTRDAEESFLAQIIKQRPEKPITEAIKITIDFYKAKPKSMPKKVVHWTKKPDLDNMVKLVLDAMNKVFFIDDSQIIELNCRKKYDEVPRTEVIIETFI